MPKIRYYGHHHLADQTGYGRAAYELAMALYRAESGDLEVVSMGPGAPAPTPSIERPDAVIVHTLPGDCHRVLEAAGLRRGDGPKLVAYTTWEALTAPLAVVQSLYDSFDQVWVPSRITAQALAANGLHGSGRDRDSAERRTHVVPHCYDERETRPPGQYADSGKFRFYWIGAWTARKNPAGLIRAFANAFHPGTRAELVLHSPGCSIDTFVATLAATGLQQSELPPIVISTQRLSELALLQLHADSDCFVSAARGEAWNLPAFDAMLAGRHVITQYGLGSDEFLADTSADLVDGWESPAHVDVTAAASSDGTATFKTIGAQGLTARSLWLEPNLSSLSLAMQSAYEIRKRTIKIDYDAASRFGYAAVATRVLELLETP